MGRPRIAKTAKDLHRNDFRLVPNGLPGVGALLQLAWEVLVARNDRPPTEVIERVSAAPARMLELADRKGTIAGGADADLVIVVPADRRPAVSATGSDAWSPWRERPASVAVRAHVAGGSTAAGM